MITALARPGGTEWVLTREGALVGSATTGSRRSGPILTALDVAVADAPAALSAIATALRAAGEQVLLVDTRTGDEVLHAAVADRDVHLVATQMRLDLDGSVAAPPRVTLEAMSAEDYPTYREQLVTAYAQDLFDAGAFTDLPDALAASELSAQELLPDGVASPSQHLWTAHDGDDAVGILWIHVDGERAYIYDIEIRPEQRRRGYGRELLDAGARAAADLGATTLGLNVFGFNEGAQALYASAGYTITEQTWRLDL